MESEFLRNLRLNFRSFPDEKATGSTVSKARWYINDKIAENAGDNVYITT